MSDEIEIELRGIRSFRGEYEALRGVSLGLARGETLFVMGGAGSGKSVLLKTAAGIALPDEGEVLYRGKSLARMSSRDDAAFRKASGFVFQDAALWSNQSLYDNLALPARLHEPGWSAAEIDRAVRRAAELVGYDEELRVRPAELSAGERKLVSLARALVLDPELLFLDDPTSGLDEAGAERVAQIMLALKERGRSVIVGCDVSELASRCADTLAILLGGSLAALGSLDEAVSWSDPAVRVVTSRLKSRVVSRSALWAGGLAGAWAKALAEDTAIAEDEAIAGSALGEKAEGPGEGDEHDALGDIINDVQEPGEGPAEEERGGP